MPCVSAPSASDTFTRQSLVEEIHNKQQHDADQESERQRQHARAVKASRRAKVRNRVLLSIAVVLLLAGVAFGVKKFAENRRIEQGLAAAQEPLAASSVAKLEAARTVLATNLDVAPNHPATLGRIALVVTHLHIRGAVEADVVRAALAQAREAGRPEGALCEGMLAALEGDFDQARRAYEGALAEEDPWVRADAAWLQAVVALGHPYDVAMEDAAVKQLEASLQETPSASNLRAFATLVARRGDLELALAKTAEARALAPKDTGLSVDEAFFKVLKAESDVGALELVDALGGTVRGPDLSLIHI